MSDDMNPSTTIGGNLELALYSKTHFKSRS
jgi:hypothetical protein